MSANLPSWLERILTANVGLLWTTLVAAIVSASVSYFFRRREIRHRLETEYEYEQRKKLRDLIAQYHGRLLNAANSLNYRFWNLYTNHDKGWLKVRGVWSSERYYFLSFVFRFLNVCALIRAFEREAVFVDARIATKRDLEFLKYLAALRWCMTDVALYEGLEYDNFDEVDHFFSDTFRQYCDAYLQQDGGTPNLEAFTQRIQTDRTFDPILRFFDSLQRSEHRLRWDRLAAFHLLLASFINIIGYPENKTSQNKLNAIAKQIGRKAVRDNLVVWLPRHGLAGWQALRIRWAMWLARDIR